jgi:hypothetical protein
MTLTLTGADIRGYYAALGVRIPEWATRNASVRCFANPDHHQHEDRTPSASVDLISGAFHCHGCGAHGGAYDAALTRHHTPRSAIDLMIEHGLTERRSGLLTARELIPAQARPQSPHRKRRTELQATEDDVIRWQMNLIRRHELVVRLGRERGWAPATMRELGLGWDRSRITIPIRDATDGLIGVLRYQPFDTGQTKMLAVPGTRLGLIPHPCTESSPDIDLVEGPPDMIAARSSGLAAIAVPGDHAWRSEWAPLLSGRKVTVVMDADPAGRAAAHRIRDTLSETADVCVFDLAPHRSDGYDLTDWLLEHPNTALEVAQ